MPTCTYLSARMFSPVRFDVSPAASAVSININFPAGVIMCFHCLKKVDLFCLHGSLPSTNANLLLVNQNMLLDIPGHVAR